MISESEKEKIQKDQLERGIRVCEEAVAKAEKYERLKDNADWKGFLDDLKVVESLHEREIAMGESMLIDAPNTGYLKMSAKGSQEYVSSRQDWIDFIIRHQIQKADCATWIKEPESIIAMAAMAREKLPSLKEKLMELSHATGLPSENGKP